MSKPQIIAFYLPQFYPTKENDEWWEPGFTEWTNVAKAKPLFKGHYQPRIPRDLGFYDLRVPEIRIQQAEMAKEAGINGFCYWHYWFAGRRLLDRVFREVVESGKPDFPFCLCWANHSWKAKTWNPEVPDRMLIEQTYPGEQDYVNHFYAMLPAFKDKRYMQVDGRLIFGIFEPADFHDIDTFAKVWNTLAKENGLKGFYFFALVQGTINLTRFNRNSYDAIVFDSLLDVYSQNESTFLKRLYKRILFRMHNPYTIKYNDYITATIKKISKDDTTLVPCIDPDFDHTPRSAYRWVVIKDSTPQKWGQLCKSIVEVLSGRDSQEQLLFIKSWNEWGEGNYLEPDGRFGDAYLRETHKSLVGGEK